MNWRYAELLLISHNLTLAPLPFALSTSVRWVWWGSSWSSSAPASLSCRSPTEPPSPTCVRSTAPRRPSFPWMTSASSTCSRPVRVELCGGTETLKPKDLSITLKTVSIAYAGRDAEKQSYITKYLKAVAMFRDYNNVSQDPDFTQVRHGAAF